MIFHREFYLKAFTFSKTTVLGMPGLLNPYNRDTAIANYAYGYLLYWNSVEIPENVVEIFNDFLRFVTLDIVLASVKVMKCLQLCFNHFENTPIQIYNQKKGKFSDKKFWYFSYSFLKHRLWVLVRTASARRF